jgi:hypothetical protein
MLWQDALLREVQPLYVLALTAGVVGACSATAAVLERALPEGLRTRWLGV